MCQNSTDEKPEPPPPATEEEEDSDKVTLEEEETTRNGAVVVIEEDQDDDVATTTSQALMAKLSSSSRQQQSMENDDDTKDDVELQQPLEQNSSKQQQQHPSSETSGTTVVEEEEEETTTFVGGMTNDDEQKQQQTSSVRRGCCSKNSSNRPQKNGKDLGVWEESLEDRANVVSRWFLSYLTPLLKLGAYKVLDQDDMGVPSKIDLADRAYQVALEAWKVQSAKAAAKNVKIKQAHQEKLSKCGGDSEARTKLGEPKLAEPSIALALVKGFGVCTILIGLVYYVVSALLGFVPVLILNDLVKFFESGLSASEYNGYAHPWVEVAALGVVPVLVSLFQTRHQTIMAHSAVFVRTAVSTLLYRKALRVSAAARAQTSTGQVVNMMSNDTAQLQRFLQFGGMTVVAPIQIILALVLIYQQVGNATWVGVGYMIMLAPINMVVFAIVSKQRRMVLKYSDLRVKMMNEILAGIRIIKFYAWERPFGKQVGGLRKQEMDALAKLAYTSAVGFSMILMSAPIVQPILVFLTYVYIQNEPLTAAKAFTTVALFNIMRFPFAFLPMGLLQYIQSKISLRRLERYLDLPELAPYVDQTKPSPTLWSYDSPDHASQAAASQKVGSVTILDGNFGWIDPDAKPIRPVNEKKERRRSSRRGSKSSKMGGSSHRGMGGSSSRGMTPSSRNFTVANASAHSAASEVSVPPVTTLQDVNLQIPAGSLTAVVGSVGSGKSSLLSAILGEMEPIAGSKVYMPRGDEAEQQVGFVSYCAQTPWVVNDTLKGNVLFGRELDQERYDKVVTACALVDDLAVLPAGDLTEIGERGINLSGGQKARVSLARALYSPRTKIMLLDDPLSAVDAHVGEHIFQNAIAGDLAKEQGLTRVLVTHHVHLLPRCDRVIVLEKGQIKHQGTYRELIERGVDFAGAVDVAKATGTSEKPDEKKQQEGSTAETADTNSSASDEPVEKLADESQQPSEQESANGASSDKTTASTAEGADTKEKASSKQIEEMKQSGKKLVKDEEREEGNVDGSAYLHYAKAGGLCVALFVCIVQGLGRASEIMSGFWLALWAERNLLSMQTTGQQLSDAAMNYYIGIYAMFGLLGVLGLTGRALLIAVHRLSASTKLHDDLTERILRAPVAFFDVTPTGRILNRFAADMDKIDLELTQSLSQGASTVFSVLGAIGAMVAATKGTFLVPLVPISYVYFLIQRWFRKTSTELQRINSIANSPIFADFSQTLSGTSTIRAYGEENRFFTHCRQSFDKMNASFVLVQLTNFWLGLRLDVLGGCMGAFIGGVAVATSGFIPAGWLGLALSYSIEVTQFLKHGVRMIATIEAQMNSVERVLYYTNNIEMEAPEYVPENDPPVETWPSGGAIEIQKASMRYRDGPLVLKELSLHFRPGEKIGVCGRTGSGKSSLMIALFRISEIEQDGGQILIDGVDTASIGTAPLRLNLSIIPQDPIVFSNTIRYNLDPFDQSTDDELWHVLKKVQMDEVIAMLPMGLEEQVAEGGENFSQGQRQLICIARSLLRKPKILVLDEATASIDNATDASIQDMIRKNFSNATVLTIAHRLNTIMDSDRVLVLDDGRVAEFDSPTALLEKDGGLFRAMVEKSRAAKDKGNKVATGQPGEEEEETPASKLNYP